MGRLTNAQKQITSIFYGIAYGPLQVVCISMTRDRTLSRHIGMRTHFHPIYQDVDPVSEIRNVYQLDHIIQIPVHLWNSEYAKRALAERQALVDKMLAERDGTDGLA